MRKPPTPSIHMPPDFIAHVKRFGGTNVQLVATKRMQKFDLDKKTSRFSFPGFLVRSTFLTGEEVQKLDAGGGLNVLMIGPSHKVCCVSLRKWKTAATRTTMYSLSKNWPVVLGNCEDLLVIDALVQLWSFRCNTELAFVLIRVDEYNRRDEVDDDDDDDDDDGGGVVAGECKESSTTVRDLVSSGSSGNTDDDGDEEEGDYSGRRTGPGGVEDEEEASVILLRAGHLAYHPTLDGRSTPTFAVYGSWRGTTDRVIDKRNNVFLVGFEKVLQGTPWLVANSDTNFQRWYANSRGGISPGQASFIEDSSGKRVWVKFRYERLRDICVRCGLLTHTVMRCSISLEGKVKSRIGRTQWELLLVPQKISPSMIGHNRWSPNRGPAFASTVKSIHQGWINTKDEMSRLSTQNPRSGSTVKKPSWKRLAMAPTQMAYEFTTADVAKRQAMEIWLNDTVMEAAGEGEGIFAMRGRLWLTTPQASEVCGK
ncbi:hypothetical protein Tsubulata_028580 [Turnera subulata]|uniref:Zinc knuckle CX2CX4HX4C domain-containing protein n=1 Tax=Turnera subulata TaxID=218843 RepID=A0A9Q0J2M3_9ROSI|nr:hypothetical protein Tsubulata_028580 [Turnera subulata]